MHENNVQEYLGTLARLEPKVDPSVSETVALASIAISLRRIADDLGGIRLGLLAINMPQSGLNPSLSVFHNMQLPESK